MANGPSAKQLLINKTNTLIVVFVGVAAFIFVFSMVATKTLIGQAAYQNRVIGHKKTALKQLKDDLSSTSHLKQSYDAFVGDTTNVLGGSALGSGPQDGDNAKIVLDALPSSYDFPGLTTSLEQLVSSQNVKINSISGTDDEVAQSGNQTSSTPTPSPIPFQLVVEADYPGTQSVISALEKSIRPIQIQTLDISGEKGKLTTNITAQTYYQPAKSLNIKKQVVK